MWAEGRAEEAGAAGGPHHALPGLPGELTARPPSSVARLPGLSSPDPERVCETEVKDFVYETFCCHGDSVALALCCALLYCLNKEPNFVLYVVL